VAEAGDIVAYSVVLVATLVVGLALLGIDAAVGRLVRRRARKRGRLLIDVSAVDERGAPRNGRRSSE
jgi:hypothetical protein